MSTCKEYVIEKPEAEMNKDVILEEYKSTLASARDEDTRRWQANDIAGFALKTGSIPLLKLAFENGAELSLIKCALVAIYHDQDHLLPFLPDLAKFRGFGLKGMFKSELPILFRSIIVRDKYNSIKALKKLGFFPDSEFLTRLIETYLTDTRSKKMLYALKSINVISDRDVGYYTLIWLDLNRRFEVLEFLEEHGRIPVMYMRELQYFAKWKLIMLRTRARAVNKIIFFVAPFLYRNKDFAKKQAELSWRKLFGDAEFASVDM